MNNNELDTLIEKKTINKSESTASIYDLVHSILFAFSVVVIILTFAFRVVHVDGPSMQNTLTTKDKLFVSNMFFTPATGDIVIISHGAQYDEPLVKRVIAVEGQSLDINFETGEVVVDGVVIDEPYISTPTIKFDAIIPSVIPKGKVFVMGDNRGISLDSRSNRVGLIDENDIIGKAYFVVFPFNHIKNIYA